MEIYPKDYATPVLGHSMSTGHIGCSTSSALKITSNEDGILFHCFKCDETVFVRHEAQSYRDRKQREAEMAAVHLEKNRRGYKLPVDFSHQIASAGIAWLGSGGWTAALIDQHGAGWSEKMARVIIPLQPSGYIARAVYPDQKPKYLSKAPENALWRSNRGVHPGTLAVTEDVLSAGRLGQFLQTEALLGTPKRWIPPTGINHLIVWTDGDSAGKMARAHLHRHCMWLGIKITDIETRRDPKRLSDREITGRLHEHYIL